jgi:hypothetical protein
LRQIDESREELLRQIDEGREELLCQIDEIREELLRQIDESSEELLRQIEECRDTGSELDLDSSEKVSEFEDNILSDYGENDEADAESDTSDIYDDLQRKIVYGKNGCKWYTKTLCTKNTRTVAKNIVLRLPGPNGDARGEISEAKLLSLFITEDTLQKHSDLHK